MRRQIHQQTDPGTLFNMQSLPGTYALVLPAVSNRSIVIGKLGTLEIKPGFYLYVGSAFGPGGLRARITHHRKNSSRPHWHMDYLSVYLHPNEVWYSYDREPREHQWVKVLAGTKGASIPLGGFGSSDCGCTSHLYFFDHRPCAKSFRRKIHANVDNHEKIFIENLTGTKPNAQIE
ncbi:MAG: GIY-YIG nuclease family protein [Desulfobacterales bacterium]|nr:GIY-YIG nuclease family protein [Desulfobacterales bacterium]